MLLPTNIFSTVQGMQDAMAPEQAAAKIKLDAFNGPGPEKLQYGNADLPALLLGLIGTAFTPRGGAQFFQNYQQGKQAVVNQNNQVADYNQKQKMARAEVMAAPLEAKAKRNWQNLDQMREDTNRRTLQEQQLNAQREDRALNRAALDQRQSEIDAQKTADRKLKSMNQLNNQMAALSDKVLRIDPKTGRAVTNDLAAAMFLNLASQFQKNHPDELLPPGVEELRSAIKKAQDQSAKDKAYLQQFQEAQNAANIALSKAKVGSIEQSIAKSKQETMRLMGLMNGVSPEGKAKLGLIASQIAANNARAAHVGQGGAGSLPGKVAADALKSQRIAFDAVGKAANKVLSEAAKNAFAPDGSPIPLEEVAKTNQDVADALAMRRAALEGLKSVQQEYTGQRQGATQVKQGAVKVGNQVYKYSVRTKK